MMDELHEREQLLVQDVQELSLLDVLRCSPGEASKVRAAREVRFLALWEQASSEERLQKNEGGDTVLHQIAFHDFDGLVRSVLTDEPTLASIPNPQKNLYPVHLAVQRAENKVAALLFELDEASSEYKTYKRELAMHFAAREGTEATMKICCDHHKGDIDVLNFHGQSPLACAIESNNAETERYLRDKRADESLVDTRGVIQYPHK
jgi:ankyrin repeat protein